MSEPISDEKMRELAEDVLIESREDADDWYDLQTLKDFLIVEETEACGPFIAATSPAYVIALLDRLKAGEAREAKLREALEGQDEMLRGIQTEIGAGKSLVNIPEAQYHNAACERAIRIIQHYRDGYGLFQTRAAKEKP